MNTRKYLIAAVVALLIAVVTVGIQSNRAASATGWHDWTYNVSCDGGVSGIRPRNDSSDPEHVDSEDSNIRIKNLDTDEVRTFNYHGPDNVSAGPFRFTMSDYGVPSSWTHFEIQWVQVNGTNFHWEGSLECGVPPVGEFEPYEVDACWTMSHSDGVEGTYEFPQSYGCTPPECGETVEQQYDTYWIRDEGDEATFEEIKINGLDSPSNDAPLEPHNYYSVVLTGDDCATETPTPTPTPTPTSTPTPSGTPTPTPTGTPTSPEPTSHPTPTDEPTSTPTIEETEGTDTSSSTAICSGGSLIVTVTDSDGNSNQSVTPHSSTCPQVNDEGDEIKEEGF